MIRPEFLYIEEADFILLDLYRFGNASSPRLDGIRPFKDVMVMKQNGIEMVVANGNGVSLSSVFDPKNATRGSYQKAPRFLWGYAWLRICALVEVTIL